MIGFLCLEVQKFRMFFSRLMMEAASSQDTGLQFNYLVQEVSNLSSVVTGIEVRQSAIEGQFMTSLCRAAEEFCGRINFENLSSFMVIGGPYLPLSDSIQAQLKRQVCVTIYSVCVKFEQF